jgi:hypothetical protein
MTGNLLYAFGETGNWKTIDKKLTLCFRWGGRLTRNLLYAFGESGNWKSSAGNLRYALGETENWEPKFITRELIDG